MIIFDTDPRVYEYTPAPKIIQIMQINLSAFNRIELIVLNEFVKKKITICDPFNISEPYSCDRLNSPIKS